METMASNIWGLLLVTGGETAFPDSYVKKPADPDSSPRER